MGSCNFGNILLINVPKCHSRKFMFFDLKVSNSSEFYYKEPGVYPSVTDNVEAINTLFQEGHNHSESCITVKVSRRTQEVEIYLAKKNLVPHSLVRTRDTFSLAMLAMNWE